MDRIWSSIQNLTSWFEENVRLLELLQAEKHEKVFLHRTIEEKDYLINNLNEQLGKLELQRISPTGDNRQADWEKTKKTVKMSFLPCGKCLQQIDSMTWILKIMTYLKITMHQTIPLKFNLATLSYP